MLVIVVLSGRDSAGTKDSCATRQVSHENNKKQQVSQSCILELKFSPLRSGWSSSSSFSIFYTPFHKTAVRLMGFSISVKPQRSARQLLPPPSLFLSFYDNLTPISWVGNQLVSAFRRQHQGSGGNSNSAQDRNSPADSAQNPRVVQFPANEEAFVIVVEVGLSIRTRISGVLYDQLDRKSK